jgi:hypothetical protein
LQKILKNTIHTEGKLYQMELWVCTREGKSCGAVSMWVNIKDFHFLLIKIPSKDF